MILQDRDGSHGAEINKLRKEINVLLDSEETMWSQRSKAHWLKEGDHNTKFFHYHASERRRKNSINGILDANGRWCETNESIVATAVSFFEDLYTTSHPSRIHEVISSIPTRVTWDMNQQLIKEFTSEEVLMALQQMHPTKSARLDDMSAIFYKKYWSIVGNDVTKMALNVLNSNMSMVEINKTNITLVPKVKHPSKMSEFRPISLCNVAYKLIAKVLANRLKAVLPCIILENQSAFLSERLIIDNVLIAFEIMHYLNNKRDGKDNFMSIKLDMSKAFNMVEWSFVEAVMEKLGFHEKWISLIMHCITTVSYSVIINGVAHDCIVP